MNERIRELERQATETVKCGLNGTSTAESFNRKKFAELIVQECLAQVVRVDDMLEDEPAQKAAVAWVGSAIAEHFGVEE